jgi:xylulokinase
VSVRRVHKTADDPADPDGIYLGLDLGTSGLKGIALRASGEVVARASAAYPTSRPGPGAAEQEPRDWIAAIEVVTAQLATDAPPSRWLAIGLSAMIPTLVTAGSDAEAVGPAITWEDSRAEPQADLLREAYGAAAGRPGGEALYEVTGQWIDGRYLLPMFLRLIDDDPARAAETVTLLGAKDYLFGWLTGRPATDPSTATGFGCLTLQTSQWNAGVLRAASVASAAHAAGAGPARADSPGPGAAPARAASADSASRGLGGVLPALPPVLPSTSTQPLRADLAARFGCHQIPVCVGAADSVLGALGLGARSPGQIAYVAGTSTVLLGVADKPLLDPQRRFLVTPLAEPGLWGLEMDLLATGSALRWLANLLGDGLDEAGVIALAAQVDPAAAPVVLPYLSPGEQGALWDPALHGTITGLTLAHDRRHLARGLVNGIILESRRCLAVLDETATFALELLAAGGSAAEPSFRADLASATGRSVLVPGDSGTDHSARGAALLARRAIGLSPPLDHPEQRPTPAQPDPHSSADWNRLWAAHEGARRALATDRRCWPATDAPAD